METQKLGDALYTHAIDGKRDGYKNYEQFNRKKMLNAMIYEKFGIGEKQSADE